MTNLEAIDRRISRRTYLSQNIATEKLDTLNKRISELNVTSQLAITYLSDGSGAFSGGKSYGFFKGVKGLIVMKGDRNLEHLKEKAGYFGEILVLEATKLGLGTCWVGGTYDKKGDMIGASKSEEVVCVITIGNVQKVNSFKENFIRGMARCKVKSIEDLSTSDAEMPDWFLSGMDAVQKAPTAKNGQKVVFHLKRNVVTASVPDDYPLDLIDLGICKLHFEYGSEHGKFQWGNNGIFVTAPTDESNA